MREWLQSRVGLAISVFTLLSLLGGGFRLIDGRYLKVSEAGEISRQLRDLRGDVLQNRLDALVAEEGAFLRASQQRRLTDLELQRLTELRRQIKRIEAQVERLQK